MYQFTTATKKIAALTKRIRVMQGGTSASKTISILLLLIDRAQSYVKERELTSIVAESIPHLKRGVIRDFKKIMQSHGYWIDKNWNATDSIYTFETGNQMEFFSSDNGDKLRGARRDWLFLNEANNVAFDAFEQLEVRTRKGVYIDFNPTNEFWLYTEVIPSRDDIELIILTYKDNESLDSRVVESIEQRKNRKGWWQVYGEGQLGEVETRIYKGWEIIDEIPHEAKLYSRGLDFGYTNDPSALVDIYKYNGGFIFDEQLYQKGMSNSKIANFILSLEEPTILTIADSSEPKSIEEIKNHGVMIIGAQKGQGSVTRGIDFVKDQKISVTKRSLNIIKEYRNYLFITDRDGKILNVPEGGFDHAMDAIRYGLSKYKETPDRSAYTKAIQQYLHPESESPRQVPQKQLKYSKRKSF